jgi:hypothetical protein
VVSPRPDGYGRKIAAPLKNEKIHWGLRNKKAARMGGFCFDGYREPRQAKKRNFSPDPAIAARQFNYCRFS